jgi:glyceraldehyde 3-phosphate dehydrogenase
MTSRKYKIAINGFGRIGRLTFNALIKAPSLDVVAINDLADANTLAHLLKYDSTYGISKLRVSVEESGLLVDGHCIQIFSQRDPADLPWDKLGVDIVVESSGKFTDLISLSKHINAGAKRVILSAPSTDNIPTIVLGVNEHTLSGSEDILSNASCTTNCLAPLVKVIEDNFGLKYGYMTTIHAYTSDQNLLDAPHKDLRRARAAARSIIPTSTGAAKAVGLVIPELKDKLYGIAMRVPVENGSCVDLTAVLKKQATMEQINDTIETAANTYLKGIMEYSEAPLVSVDIIGNKHSCVFDSKLTSVNENLVKLIAWYDNESAYAQRMAELTVFISKFI